MHNLVLVTVLYDGVQCDDWIQWGLVGQRHCSVETLVQSNDDFVDLPRHRVDSFLQLFDDLFVCSDQGGARLDC